MKRTEITNSIMQSDGAIPVFGVEILNKTTASEFRADPRHATPRQSVDQTTRRDEWLNLESLAG